MALSIMTSLSIAIITCSIAMLVSSDITTKTTWPIMTIWLIMTTMSIIPFHQLCYYYYLCYIHFHSQIYSFLL